MESMTEESVICIAGDSSPEIIISDLTIDKPEDEMCSPNMETIISDKLVDISHDVNDEQHLQQITITTDLDSSDKLDELTSLEREIAQLHHVEPSSPIHAKKVPNSQMDAGLLFDEDPTDKVLLEMQTINRSSSHSSGSTRGSRISSDRINGQTDKKNSNSRNSESKNSFLTHNATKNSIPSGVFENEDLIAVLKGIDEDDPKEGQGVTIEGEGEYQIMEIIEDIDADEIEANAVTRNTKSNKSNKKLEAERQVALEQIEMINRNKARRRKQDMKPMVQHTDLINSLVSEWSDDDAGVEETIVNINNAKGLPTSKSSPQAATTKSATQQHSKKGGNTTSKDTNATSVRNKVAAKKPEVKEKSISSKNRDITKSPSNVAVKQKKESPAPQTPKLPPLTVFKRTRVIKRKIIWDPDAPETSFSYANLVKSSSATKKEPVAKKGRITPQSNKNKESSVEKNTTSKQSESQTKAQPKRQAELQNTNANKKKKFSEIDRLLGDEGALNMLNSLEPERHKRAGSGEAMRNTIRARTSTPTFEKPIKKDRPVVKVKRAIKGKPSETWDFVYKNQKEDAMIARRRSTSSFSSSASHHRLSLDGPVKLKEPQVSLLKLSSQSMNSKQFEFAKPENKTQKLKKPKVPQIIDPLSDDMKKAGTNRNVRSPEESKEKNKITSRETQEMAQKISKSTSDSADVVVNRIGKVAQIVLSTHRAKIPNTFTVQLLNNLSRALDKLSEDNKCYVALIISHSSNFCQGIDFTDLTLGSSNEKQTAAEHMAKAVKNFLQTLATFPKPLIAGVNGSNSGLGVTMLPLFDFVIGSDKGSYEAPYARIGQIPEGYCIWSETPKIRSSFKIRLLWLCEKLQSNESSISGLVTKLTSPNKVNEEALNCAKKIASFSAETYRSMKKNSIECNLENILTGLEDEHDLVLEQWTSKECLENFEEFIENGHWK